MDDLRIAMVDDDEARPVDCTRGERLGKHPLKFSNIQPISIIPSLIDAEGLHPEQGDDALLHGLDGVVGTDVDDSCAT